LHGKRKPVAALEYSYVLVFRGWRREEGKVVVELSELLNDYSLCGVKQLPLIYG
jgi:hypothetical protein